MHDPLVVAFTIPRPWPQRDRTHDSVQPGRAQTRPRRRSRLHHDCTDDCDRRHPAKPCPWWNPRSWTPFWTVAGRGWYWPPAITVWHREPGGHDSGEVCRHYTRTRTPNGTYETQVTDSWRFHVHHWRIQIHAIQAARRWLLTRCQWCGGRSRKGDRVNISHQRGDKRSPWWRGERGLYHLDCSAYENARRSCVCDEPIVERGGSFGKCALCGKHAAGRLGPNMLARRRLLAAVPVGGRDPRVWGQVKRLAEEEKEAA